MAERQSATDMKSDDEKMDDSSLNILQSSLIEDVSQPSMIPSAFGEDVSQPSMIPSAFGEDVSQPSMIPSAFGEDVSQPSMIPSAFGEDISQPSMIPSAFGEDVRSSLESLGLQVDTAASISAEYVTKGDNENFEAATPEDVGSSTSLIIDEAQDASSVDENIEELRANLTYVKGTSPCSVKNEEDASTNQDDDADEDVSSEESNPPLDGDHAPFAMGDVSSEQEEDRLIIATGDESGDHPDTIRDPNVKQFFRLVQLRGHNLQRVTLGGIDTRSPDRSSQVSEGGDEVTQAEQSQLMSVQEAVFGIDEQSRIFIPAKSPVMTEEKGTWVRPETSEASTWTQEDDMTSSYREGASSILVEDTVLLSPSAHSPDMVSPSDEESGRTILDIMKTTKCYGRTITKKIDETTDKIFDTTSPVPFKDVIKALFREETEAQAADLADTPNPETALPHHANPETPVSDQRRVSTSSKLQFSKSSPALFKSFFVKPQYKIVKSKNKLAKRRAAINSSTTNKKSIEENQTRYNLRKRPKKNFSKKINSSINVNKTLSGSRVINSKKYGRRYQKIEKKKDEKKGKCLKEPKWKAVTQHAFHVENNVKTGSVLRKKVSDDEAMKVQYKNICPKELIVDLTLLENPSKFAIVTSFNSDKQSSYLAGAFESSNSLQPDIITSTPRIKMRKKMFSSDVSTIETQEEKSLRGESVSAIADSLDNLHLYDLPRCPQYIDNKKIHRNVSSHSSFVHTSPHKSTKSFGFTSGGDKSAFQESRRTYCSDEKLNEGFDCKDNLNVECSLSSLLKLCGQEDCLNFKQIYNWRHTSARKIGEGTYGEVFMTTEKRCSSVIKVIAFLEHSGDQGMQTVESVYSEVKVSKSLSDLRMNTLNQTKNFNLLKSVKIVKGAYPDELIEAWDFYTNDQKSYNIRPDYYGEQQLFAILEMEYGGHDLENFSLHNAEEAVIIFKQIAISLAIAEEVNLFEHRDLHLGNVLVLRDNSKQLSYTLRGEDFTLKNNGLVVSIIDFTLSRVLDNGCIYYHDLSEDITLFNQSGDQQYEVLKKIRSLLCNNWKSCHLRSNVLWLNYLCLKFTEATFSRSKTKKHRTALAQLQEFNICIKDCFSSLDVIDKLQLAVVTCHNVVLDKSENFIYFDRNSCLKK